MHLDRQWVSDILGARPGRGSEAGCSWWSPAFPAESAEKEVDFEGKSQLHKKLSPSFSPQWRSLGWHLAGSGASHYSPGPPWRQWRPSHTSRAGLQVPHVTSSHLASVPVPAGNRRWGKRLGFPSANLCARQNRDISGSVPAKIFLTFSNTNTGFRAGQ